MANWTPEEAARVLAGRINQPQYVEWVIKQVLKNTYGAQLENTQPHPAYVGHKRCLACGEYHYGISGLPCPKMTPVARGGEHG